MPTSKASEISGTLGTVSLFQSADVAILHFTERKNMIVYGSEFEQGRHFAAMDVPNLLIGDVRKFFRSYR